MKFQDYNISPAIKQNLEKMGFKKPTDIQFKTIPAILKGEDVLAIAQTGTGKTGAFAIPIVNKLHEEKSRHRPPIGIRCVIMVPTRELAIQIAGEISKFSKNTRVKNICLYGGVEQDPQIKLLLKGADILVTTPGRMFDLVSQGYVNLRNVSTVVLDEADHMLDLGFYKDIQDLIRFLPKRRQTLFFSATIDDKIKKLAYSLVNKPIRIQLSPKDPVSKNVDHALIFVEMDDKRFVLERLLREHEFPKTLVFVRTKVRADRVQKAMERVSIEALVLHGDVDQKERIATLNSFRGGSNVLIATDVSARGIDIQGVQFVVNYDMPDRPEYYVHRVGRTGRGNNRGKALSFCSEQEKKLLEDIEAYIHNEIDRIEYSKQEIGQTRLLSDDQSNDWKSIVKTIEKEKEVYKAKKNKRKKK